jgi:hypothetical protein
MPASRPLLGKVLDLVVYAPVGLAAQIRSDVPDLVAAGRTRVTERVQVARWVGEMAVTYGRRELERRLTTVADDHHVLEPLVAVPLAAVAAHVPALPPFDGYEQLAAAQIVQLLVRLPDADLVMIREYEAAHRARRTILSKLEQLLGG